MMHTLLELPPPFAATRESLRAVACYAISPARKMVTGRIGLRPVGRGFGTPVFDDGTSIVLDGDELVGRDDRRERLTTVRAAAGLLGVEPSPDPGVGHDLPPFEPDRPLDVDAAASRALGDWYRFGQDVLDRLTADLPDVAVSEAQLWPEHFDLAVVVSPADGRDVNVGFSPGDEHRGEPYLYVGPHDVAGLTDPFWNEPFGAAVGYSELAAGEDPVVDALGFITRGLELS